MKFENTEVWGFKHALRGMRNPKESWHLSDSDFSDECHRTNDTVSGCESCQWFDGFGKECLPLIGPNDMKLATQLINAGSEHRKFIRQIFVSVDITAPLYWWKEYDTYKVGTVANSTSTMHKLTSKPITIDCFETDDYHPELPFATTTVGEIADEFITKLEFLRNSYLSTGDVRYWKELIRWLPESWLQMRTCTLTYENLISIRHQRANHKLNEWSGIHTPDIDSFIGWMRSLPYAKEFIFYDEKTA